MSKLIAWWNGYQKRRMFRRLLKSRIAISYVHIGEDTAKAGRGVFVEWAIIERVFWGKEDK